ncbi:hypothetical protein ACFL2A_00730 [Thermodesulfobacteriota bacterium]
MMQIDNSVEHGSIIRQEGKNIEFDPTEVLTADRSDDLDLGNVPLEKAVATVHSHIRGGRSYLSWQDVALAHSILNEYGRLPIHYLIAPLQPNYKLLRYLPSIGIASATKSGFQITGGLHGGEEIDTYDANCWLY